MYELEVKNVTKVFDPKKGGTRALDNASFTVEKGKIYGFIGPNGAGKTTTIKIILDLINPTKGTAYIRGRESGNTEIRKITGYFPEKDAFYEEMSARQYLTYLAALSGVEQSKIEENVEKWLEFFDLSNVGDKAIKTYSSGMKRKLLFAQVLVHEPEILILDEPTTYMDPIAQAQIMKILRERVKNGATVFISSHHIEELELIVDEVIIIDKGKILSATSVEALRETMSKHIKVKLSEKKDVDKVKKILKTLNLKSHSVINANNIIIKESAGDLAKIQKKFLKRCVSSDIGIKSIGIEEEGLWNIVLKLLKEEGEKYAGN